MEEKKWNPHIKCLFGGILEGIDEDFIKNWKRYVAKDNIEALDERALSRKKITDSDFEKCHKYLKEHPRFVLPYEKVKEIVEMFDELYPQEEHTEKELKKLWFVHFRVQMFDYVLNKIKKGYF